MKVKPIILFLFMFLLSCSASKQAFKEAKEYEDAGLYVEAAEADLKALHKNKKFKDAKVHLRKVAPLAYNELLENGENATAAGQWDQAVDSYAKMDDMLNQCHRYGVSFETINVRERLQQAKGKAAAHHYKNAEELYAAKSWRKAANAYLKAHVHVPNYNLSHEKAIKSFINSGDFWLRKKEHDKALDSYHKVLDIAAGHSGAKKKIARAYFSQGRTLFGSGVYRGALEKFELSLKYNEAQPGIEKWLDKAYKEAVQYVAVFPFLNGTKAQVDGYRIAGDIITQLTHANLKFADFLPQPETLTLLNRANTPASGRVSEGELIQIAEEEGLDSFVWGAVRTIDVRDKPEEMHEYGHEKIIVVQDSSGKDVEETETIYYREYTTERQVTVRLRCRVIDTATGKILFEEKYRQQITDLARWVAYQGSIYDLPEKKRGLLDASRDPRDIPILINEMIFAIVDKISRDLIGFYQ